MQRWPRLLALLVMVLAIYQGVYLAVYLWRQLHGGSGPPFGDFMAFWSFARFIRVMPAEQIYNVALLQDFQQKLPGGFQGFYPYLYPPIFLLYLWPLGWLGYLPAYCVWITTTFVAYLAAVGGRAGFQAWHSPRLWLAIVAPTTLFTLISGQNGFLTAALVIGGFYMNGRSPLLGGIILGGLAFKPQLFILVPVVLLASRQWRTLAGLVMSVLGLASASAVAFGPAIWLHWLHAAPTFWQLFQDNLHKLIHLMPSVAASVLNAGVSQASAQALQVGVTLGVIVCLWLMFRRGARMHAAPRALDVAALQVGVFLASPYFFIYDMPMVTSAVGTTIDSCTQADRQWQPGETAVLVAALLLPIAMFSGVVDGWPIGPLTLLPLFAVIVRAGRTMPA